MIVSSPHDHVYVHIYISCIYILSIYVCIPYLHLPLYLHLTLLFVVQVSRRSFYPRLEATHTSITQASERLSMPVTVAETKEQLVQDIKTPLYETCAYIIHIPGADLVIDTDWPMDTG